MRRLCTASTAPLFGVFPFELDGSTAYWYAAMVLLLVFAVCKVVVNSPFGLTVRGVRENPVRMRLLGVPVLRRLVMMYIISGFLAGIAGGLSAQVTQLVALDSFSFVLSGNVLIMLVLGGTGSLERSDPRCGAVRCGVGPGRRGEPVSLAVRAWHRPDPDGALRPVGSHQLVCASRSTVAVCRKGRSSASMTYRRALAR